MLAKSPNNSHRRQSISRNRESGSKSLISILRMYALRMAFFCSRSPYPLIRRQECRYCLLYASHLHPFRIPLYNFHRNDLNDHHTRLQGDFSYRTEEIKKDAKEAGIVCIFFLHSPHLNDRSSSYQ